MNHLTPTTGNAAELVELILIAIALSQKRDYPDLQKRLEQIFENGTPRPTPTLPELCGGWFGL